MPDTPASLATTPAALPHAARIHVDYFTKWGHDSITRGSLERIHEAGKTTIPQMHWDELVEILVAANKATDKAPYNAIPLLFWHFNRRKGDDYSIWIKLYTNNIKDRLADVEALQSTRPLSLGTAHECLRILGRVTHAWEDYYAHAVAVNYTEDSPWKDIGILHGSPDEPAAGFKPSSWGGILSPGEHWWIEPHYLGPDSGKRVLNAELFVATKLAPLLASWWDTFRSLYK